MANPNVRPHLEFFPIDAGGLLSDAVHGKRWLHDMDPELLTPMIRHAGQDYYIFEPTLIVNETVCMPFRWFKRLTQLHAFAWIMLPIREGAEPGWKVLKNSVLEISKEDLVSSFPFLTTTCHYRGLPDPRNIFCKSIFFFDRALLISYSRCARWNP